MFDRAPKTESVALKVRFSEKRLVHGSKKGSGLVSSLARLTNLRHFEIDKLATSVRDVITTDLATIKA